MPKVSISLTWITAFASFSLLSQIQEIALVTMDAIKIALGLSRSDCTLESLDLEGVASLIKEGKVRNIITAVGAGISTCMFSI